MMTSTRSLRRFTPRPSAGLRLVCLPHAGGMAAFYRDWSRLLPPDIEVVAVQYPGRAERFAEPAISDLSRLCAALAGEISALDDRPVGLFGHSMGAILAFELARELASRENGQPVRLFVSSRHAPHIQHSDTVHLAGETGLRAELRRLGQTPDEILANDSMMALALPALLADYTAAENYRYQQRRALSCPITALVGDADPGVPTGEASAWREHTTSDFDLTVLPGDHFYLVPQRDTVLRLVAAQLT
jgi:pyochelin biosynthesis protein PchC